MTLHSVRHDHHPSRGPTREGTQAVMIPKALGEYGEHVAELFRLGAEMERCFEGIARVEKQLREYGCDAPRPDLSPPVRAALNQWRGEGFWER